MSELESFEYIKFEHSFHKEGRGWKGLFSFDYVCACGYRAKVSNGIASSVSCSFVEIHHWLDVQRAQFTPWTAQVNDLIGGWVVTDYPHPLSEHSSNQKYVIADCMTQTDAELIADLLNHARVSRPKKEVTWPQGL